MVLLLFIDFPNIEGGPVQVELVIEGEKESGILFQYVGSSRARVILDSDLSKEPTYVKQSQITVSTAVYSISIAFLIYFRLISNHLL